MPLVRVPSTTDTPRSSIACQDLGSRHAGTAARDAVRRSSLRDNGPARSRFLPFLDGTAAEHVHAGTILGLARRPALPMKPTPGIGVQLSNFVGSPQHLHNLFSPITRHRQHFRLIEIL